MWTESLRDPIRVSERRGHVLDEDTDGQKRTAKDLDLQAHYDKHSRRCWTMHPGRCGSPSGATSRRHC